MRSFLNFLDPRSTSTLLLAGALIGAAAAACDPKTIGNESAGNNVCQPGDTKPAEDGCNTCSCADGEWACTQKACGMCVDGETKPADDGCNTCTCNAGQWGCTEKACPGTTSSGGECVDGEMKPAPDGCNVCTCQDGQWGCTEKGCVDTTGGETTDGGSASETETAGPVGVCGDGLLDPGEQCDDGNVAAGDGCGAGCELEDSNAILVCQEPFPKDMLFIDAAAIKGDALELDLSYGGGCGTHVIALCWGGEFLESEPVQVVAQLSHASDDPCDAIVSEKRTIDLVPLKADYQKAYQKQSGQISINLQGWQGGQLLYSF